MTVSILIMPFRVVLCSRKLFKLFAIIGMDFAIRKVKIQFFQNYLTVINLKINLYA